MLISFFVFLVISYAIALRPSLDLARRNGQLNVQLEKARSAPEKIALLTRQSSAYALRAAEFSDSKEVVQRNLLRLVSQGAERYPVTLAELQYLDFNERAGIGVESFRISFTGTFKSLTQTVDLFEKNISGAQIVSVIYETKEDRFNKRKYLECTLIIQSIIKNEDSL